MATTPELPVVVLSHRGPVSFRRQEGGERAVSRGAGGLVTALTGMAGELDDAVWVCVAVTDEDAAVARESEGRAVPVVLTEPPRLLEAGEEPDGPVLDVRMVDVDRQAHDDFYTVIANPLLWFVQHGLYGLGTSPVLTERDREAFEDGYVRVNAELAAAVVSEVRQRTKDAPDGASNSARALVMLHDYHFYLVAEQVRREVPGVVLSHFVHIPWPSPDGLRVLPPDMRDRILRGLLGNDVVAFHTRHFARNFLLCAQELLDLPVDLRRMTVEVDGRTVAARSYPISIDVAALDELAAGEAVAGNVRDLEPLVDDGRQLLLRVDRTDPSKNIVRGFLAFERLLEQHPELAGTVTFLALLQPSRQDVPEYAEYLTDLGGIATRVNAAYAGEGHAPVDLRMVEDLPLAVAAYSLCDAVLVNSVADGMNLVAKEAVVASRRDTVLLLSESTGAHEELGPYALTVHPFDVQQQADALWEALSMPAEERRTRREAAAAVVRDHDVAWWLQTQLDDLAELTGLPTGA